VVDGITGAPLQGVTVLIEGTEWATRSGRDGSYSLTVPSTGAGTTVTVTVALPGYASQTHTLTLSADASTLDVALFPMRAEAGDEAEARRIRESISSALPAAEQARMAVDAASIMVAPGSGGLAGRYNDAFNTESYAHVAESGFLAVSASPLSTFSIDVDRASYSNIRRFINDGVRPPVDAVRIEEMINYFPYDYPVSDSRHPFTVTTEVSHAPWMPAHKLVRVGIQAEPVDAEDLPPNNLVFLLDVSGSMNAPDKLPLLKSALRMLVNQLRAEDRVAMVVYAGAAGLVLPSTSGAEKETILDALESLRAGGSTAGGAGLQLAYQVAAQNHLERGNNRVILATDGDFNVGPSSDGEMIRLIEEKREQGTFLSVLGFGTGDLKDSKMEQVADHGNGNYAYIDGVLEARKQLVSEMGGTLLTVAKDVKIQVEFNPAAVASYRLIGYENRLLADEDFNDDTKDAGELGAGHSVTALYEVVPVGVDSNVATSTVDPLRYQAPTGPDRSLDSDELLYVKLRYKEPTGTESVLMSQPVVDSPGSASAELRFAGAVAAFGMILRDSEHCGDFGLNDVVELARSARGEDPDGYRHEFVRLVETTRDLGLLEQEVY
jgi:Ca-activated chloride channel family protein